MDRLACQAVSNPADIIVMGSKTYNHGTLWVGGLNAVTSDFLTKNRIGLVVSLCQEAPRVGPPFVQIHAPVRDTTQDIDKLNADIPELIRKIHEARMVGVNILVHCRMGVQRAPTVAVYYLSRYLQYDLRTAKELVVQRRPIAFYAGSYCTFF